MDKKQRNTYIKIGVVVLLLLGGFWLYNDSQRQGVMEEFAICLSQNELTMYGTDTCPYCQQQKAMFGDAFKYVDYRNCEINPEVCEEMSIEGYPTWIKGEQRLSGVQEISTLGDVAGCAAP